MARAWVIIPPMETPTTWARSIPSAPSSAAASSAMSSTMYGTELASPLNSATKSGTPSNFVERPESRLSKRTVKKP